MKTGPETFFSSNFFFSPFLRNSHTVTDKNLSTAIKGTYCKLIVQLLSAVREIQEMNTSAYISEKLMSSLEYIFSSADL